MTNEEARKLKDQAMQVEIEQFNTEAVVELMAEWCINVSENIKLMRKCKNLTQMTMYGKMAKSGNTTSKHAICLAAAPQLKDEDIKKLKDFKGDIITVNKNYKKLYDLGIEPSWVVMLDGHPISHRQFEWMQGITPKSKFFVSSVVYPPTLRTIMECTDEVYGFNPVDDSARGPVRISKSWEWMNDKMEFEHGGSVGSLAVHLAASLYYEKVGLLGYGLYEKPNPAWTLEEAKEREYIYYPDTDEVCAIPMHFKAYLAHILWTVQSTGRVAWYNLSDTPLFRHSPLLIQSTVDEFIKEAEHE